MGRKMLEKTKQKIENGQSLELGELGYALKKFVEEFGVKSFNYIEVGLDEANELMLKNIIKATPKGETGELKKAWSSTERKYKGVRYIKNNAKRFDVKTGRFHNYINYLEFSKKGKPFVRKTFKETYPKIKEIVIKNLEKIKYE